MNNNLIPYGKQAIDESDIQAVVDVLRSDYLTQGPAVPAFEKAIADYCNVRFTIAANSATSILHIACLALGVEKGDIVWTSPVTFVASANCALYCGAEVDFVDIDARTYNMSIECLKAKLLQARKSGRLPKVVIPVHLSGQSCDMEVIHQLSQEYGFSIIEDASHAVGGKYKGGTIGNCQYSDITVLSFHPVKIITSGEGGIGTTNNPALARKMELFRSHGITRDESEMTKKPDGPYYYEQLALGFNYRLTDIQAALGSSQLKKIDSFVLARHKIAGWYDSLLKALPLVLPWRSPEAYSSYHLYIIRLTEDSGITHKAFFEKLRSAGILVNLHYIPVYRQPYYQKYGFNISDFPEAENYYRQAVSLPMYATLSDAEVRRVVAEITDILQKS